MIYYELGWHSLVQIKGSVFPKALKAAVPCATLAAAMRWAINRGYLAFMEADDSILTQTQAWAGFSVLVGFLIIFRSSQAYSRFWDGCTATHHMRADWFDAASALVAFTTVSKAPKDQIARFKHTVIRLVSMMHSAAFMDLEELNNKWGTTSEVKADIYELLDPLGIDPETLNTLYESKDRVMLIFQWMQLLIVQNMDNGVLNVPAPILSRAYQELSHGMVAFHECIKISDTPFPFPYAQNCDFLLVLHWSMVPIVVTQWVTQPFWAFIFVFMQVFVLYSLNYIAVEIENPFGTDDNAIDGHHMQDDMNRHLLMLVNPATYKVPELSTTAIFSVEPEPLPWADGKKSFADIWKKRKRTERKMRSKRYYYRNKDAEQEAEEAEEAEEDHAQEEHRKGPPRGDPLREEARPPAGAPGEPCTPPPALAIGRPCAPPPAVAIGLKGPWASKMEEGCAPSLHRDKGVVHDARDRVPPDPSSPDVWHSAALSFARSDKGVVHDARDRVPPDPSSPDVWHRARWEALPDSSCRRSSASPAPSRRPGERSPSRSDEEDAARGPLHGRSSSQRSSSQRSQQRRGRRRG